MAPEVMVCETFKDKPYDYKADIWSFGITLIELAQMEPPNHEMSAMRVLIKIQKSDPPKLSNSNKWSQEFSDFLTRCLKKSPDERLSAKELLSHRFCSSSTNPRPILELLSEARADVIEEQIEEIDDDNSLTSGSTPDNGELSTDGTDITDLSVRNITVNDDDQEPESVIVISTSNSTKTDDSGIGFENEHNIATTNDHSRVKTNFENSRSSSDDSKSSIGDHKNNDYDILHKRDQSCCSFGGDSVRLMADEILDSLYDSLTTEESKRKSETSNGGYTHSTNPNVSRILIAVPESPEGAEIIDDETFQQQKINDT
uniref:Protein kinase domain-containing protein n=1 Tax=Romanomermis culicivorax TaxID=13658 RepID=A0A915K2Z0_ROMCU